MSEERMGRRTFILDCAARVAGAGLLTSHLISRHSWGATGQTAPKQPGEVTMEYRTLGRTGLKVSAVSLGAMRLNEPAVMHKAVDLGINYFDTAHSYQNGNNERMLGNVARERGRDKLLLATKVHPFQLDQEVPEEYRMLAKKTLHEMTEESLKRLQTDYVDVLFIHNIMDKSWPLNQEVLAFLEKTKKEGKARFVGISIHDPRCYVEAIEETLKAPVYDVILAWFNFKSPPEYGAALKKAHSANRGIIAMKTQSGGYDAGKTATVSPQQAALAWVLEKDFVDCTIPGMVNMEQLLENVAAVGRKVGWSERKTLHTYYNKIRNRYCIMCGACSATCSKTADIAAINRALMYYEGYKDFDLGCQTYRLLTSRVNGGSCEDCSSPTCRCVNGIRIAQRMRHAHRLFA